MSKRKFLIPEFGPFAGMRILSSGSLVAMPHAAAMLADFGAEVIHLERPGIGDTWRMLPPHAQKGEAVIGTSWMQDARNRLSMSLEVDLKIPEVKEVFMDLIRESDVFMENMVWLDKFGIQDDELLAVNPKLVVAHLSGYGNPRFGGIPEVCDRASYDMIGQAFSGFMHLNGEAEPAMPSLAKPWTSDYISALHLLFGVMAGYHHAQKTGQGQVVDVAQYEANARIMADTFVSYTAAGILRTRGGASKSLAFQPYGVYADKNRDWVAIGTFGPAVYARFIKAVGWDIEYFNHKEAAGTPQALKSPKGQELDAKITAWAAEHTVEEIVEQLSKFKVPCSRVNTAKTAVEDPHWASRENFVTYEDQTLKQEIKAFGIVPKLSETPGKVWRGAPALGQDTYDILTKILNYSPEKIQALQDKKLI
jgi:crotonobetainyl-CoA:carnitine CoA-transferase CaiB-like acyl-CoA transferase